MCDLSSNWFLLVALVTVVSSESTGCGTAAQCRSAIVRPCPNFEVDCVREYLQRRCGCWSPGECIETTLDIGKLTNYLPYFNTTSVEYVNITGLDSGYVKEFYVNEETNRMVLSVGFGRILIGCNSTILYYQPAAEVVPLEIEIVQYFDSMELTTIFKDAEYPDLRSSETHGYFPAITDYTLKSVDHYKSHPVYPKLIGAAEAKLDVVVQELEMARSPKFANLWIQNYVCNFNVPLRLASHHSIED